MPNKIRRNSVVEMLSKVPVNRGSLLKSLESLLKTIESSETAVMIPTLLRDKCNFDAWELIFVAKILKASILGHTDLVEFYMNHMRSLIHQQQNQKQTGTGESSATQSPLTPTRAPLTSPMSSPNLLRSPSDPMAMQAATSTANSPPFSPSSSVCSSKTTSSGSNGTSQSKSQTSSSVWVSASSCLASSLSSSSTLNSDANYANSSGFASSATTCDSIASLSTNKLDGSKNGQEQQQVMQELQSQLSSLSCQPDTSPVASSKASQNGLASPNGLACQRQAQPPSLLQLTTTNNHINSIAQVSLSNTDIDAILAQQSASNSATTFNLGTPLSNSSTPTALDGVLSISTGSALNAGASSFSTTPNGAPSGELKTSRSAGCLFRVNSCASSPRTPNTAHSVGQQLAEQPSLPSDDPSAPVKLLLQIEQLKASILSVKNQLESVVELYKKSIESIST